MKRHLILSGALILTLAACGGDDDSEPEITDTTVATAVADTTQTVNDTPDTTPTETTAPAPAAPSAGSGSATLTVGDATYEFDNYYCLAGPENTGNERVSLSSGAMGTVDGVRVQLDASIQDPDEEGKMEGEGVIQSVSLDDIEDFENPTISLSAISGFFGEPDWLIEYDGSTVTAEALFDDGTTEEIEEIPGTLQATCGG